MSAGWDDQTDALPGPRRRKTQHMFGTIMPEIAATQTTKHDPVRPKKSRAPNLPYVGPARRAIRRDDLGFLRAPDREDDGNSHGCDPTTCGDAPALNENLRCVGVELEPPDEEGKWLIDRPAANHEPGGTELRLVSQTPGGPLRRSPEEAEHDDRDKEQLPPKDACC